MGNMKFLDDMMEEKLLNMETAYLAKVISFSGKTAKIQPLGKTKARGETAHTQSPLSNVPVAESARWHIEKVRFHETDLAKIKPLKPGDIVVVVCCDRDISDAKNGVNSTPAIGHHSKSDSVIVGII